MANISSADLRASNARNHPASRLSAFQGVFSQLIRCDIVFGMPSQDCRGTGICKLASEYEASLQLKNDCRNTVAFAGRAGEGDRITLVFFRELLCSQLYSRHFRKGILELPESCPLPDSLIEHLQLSGQVLLPGRYAVTEQEGCFLVDIACGNI